MSINKVTKLSTLLLLIMTTALAQPSDYFQQRVDYRIVVTLNDGTHTLTGRIEMDYYNNAPTALDTIYMHLWPNAYSRRNTAFAKQQLQNGDDRFYFAPDSALGGLADLAFTVDDAPVVWQQMPENPDIAFLLLEQPLALGAKRTIATPFTLKIPASFSRLGHVGQSYQLTQWFPKPAVYDRQGWHPMPYLELGEFYSEFGNFDVTITLPQNYVVGATGVLQTESEKAFLETRIEESNTYLRGLGTDSDLYPGSPFPPSSSQRKTIRYTAENVHDFAWFADKRFFVQKGMVDLPSGQKLEVWTMFTPTEAVLWKEAVDYVKRTVLFYSEKLGAYPYPQATAVQSALSAGAGMEYPMITVIGTSGTDLELDRVITHEVGHNWFYGILATNERQHPWMDEGLNTYYENRYMRRFYGSDALEFGLLPDFLMESTELGLVDMAYLYTKRRNRDQPIGAPSANMTKINYGLNAYLFPGKLMHHLEAYVGQNSLDLAMQAYYTEWKFKHPQPEDFRSVLERELARDLSWFFDGFINSTGDMDYRIKAVEQTGNSWLVTVRNAGNIAAPIALAGMRGEEVVNEVWTDGFTGTDVIELPIGDYDRLVLDPNLRTFDIDRQDNTIRLTGALKKVEPLQVSVVPGLETGERSRFNASPAIGWNNYDKFMLGLSVYNASLLGKKFEFGFTPMYSFVTKEIVGLGELRYHFLPDQGLFQRITLGAGMRKFNYFRNNTLDYDLKYRRLMPYARFEFRPKYFNSDFRHYLHWRTIYVDEQRAQFDSEGNFTESQFKGNFIHELSYAGESDQAIHPYRFRVALEQQSFDFFGDNESYLKLSLEGEKSYTYKQNRNIDFRLFAGFFLDNTRRNAGALIPAAFNLASQGYNDYRYEELYLGRTDQRGVWSQQIDRRDGAMKLPIGSAFGLGRSNNFIIALNIQGDLPFRLPVKPYFDIGYFENAMPTGDDDDFRDQLLWSGGLSFDIGDGFFSIHFPLINSSNIQEIFEEQGGYFERVSFTLDLKRLNPFNLADGFLE